MATDLEGFNLESNSNLNVIKKKNDNKKSGSFQSFGFSAPVLKGLYKKGYKVPTPIQRKTIPLILQGRDVVGMARTGSGKTACFLLPLFEKLSKKTLKSQFSTRALIFSPTRELALQTLKFIKELGKFTFLKAVAVLGGDSMDYQFNAVHNNPDIIVATPGRFLHLCIEMNLKLHSVEYVVFDEADRLFEMGFGEQLKEILDRLGDARQTVLFSATLPKLLLDFANAGLNNPVLLRLDVESKLPRTLDLAFLLVKQDEKLASLLCLLQNLPENSQTLIFVATKHHVEYLHMILDKANISNTYIYSDLDPSARKINAAKFQNKKCSVFIVTDVAARGVDIPHLDYVINYHFPSKSKLFVHRVGRCARAGRTGTAFSLVSLDETPYMLDLHLFLGKNLHLIKGNNIEEQLNCENAVGKIPTFLVENQQSELETWHNNYIEIFSMQKVCMNSYKKYLTSRPGVSNECMKKIKEIDLTEVGIHPFFKKYCMSDETKAVDFLQEIKNYRPKGTIFELNLSNKFKCYSIMKTTKKKHEQHILNFKKKNEKTKDIAADNQDFTNKDIKVENLCEVDIKNIINKGNKRKNKSNQFGEEKKCKFMDENFYIPHRASDEHTERGFAVNNFGNEANKVSFDLTADCDEGMKICNQLKKWDKKRKKIVNVEHQRVGKFKTESGNWISQSYQSNRYAKWKERCKEVEEDNSDENEETLDSKKKHFVKRNDFPNTKRGRSDRKTAEKLKAKAKLKRPEQILKTRMELEHKQRKSLPRILKKQWRRKNNNKFK